MRYEGEWENGLQTGYGKQYKDDSTFEYKGEWINGYKHGQGKQVFEDGAEYDGTWVEDAIDGEG